MKWTKRTVVLWSVAVFAVSFVLLAPVECVGYCEEFDATAGTEGRCLSSCTTLSGYAAVLGAAWFLLPVLLIGVALVLRRPC